ncbi:conserved protein of unknown function [Candidatus Hydrogenisulfobacillus filiaventi]|uniref:Ketopantoate reductase n=1 Tax=Candidatus Hydrogenisulfobacillus filiaventi TaxID=2707344 RepID=A0A6F8ZDE1_9FIRM|nr:conserved protein of unknown function [Candidatus Hydrogenisulfobacillus filiaventi]
MLDDYAVVVGMGQLGRVFAQAFLAAGTAVIPALRRTPLDALAAAAPEPRLVLVATAEDDLPPALNALPPAWRGRVGLLQNELVPAVWEAAGITDPTVAVVWFEKKPGMEVRVILPSPVWGPAAAWVADALGRIGIPAVVLEDYGRLVYELVLKNVYIWTTNIAGLAVGGTAGELWERHRPLAEAVLGEALAVQEALTGQHFDPARLQEAVVAALAADPAHRLMGRSARARLARALAHARRLGVAVPTLERIAADTASAG